jgi:leucyl/phenylalanyl-tRNA---protein transferase
MLLRLRPGDYGRLFSEGIEPEPAPPPAALRLRRQAAFRENLATRAQRLVRVAARFLRPRRIADLPATFDLLLRDHRAKSGQPADPHDALPSADGLVRLAADLTPASMMEAYGAGLSPSACLGPVAWHSRARRLVAPPSDLVEVAIPELVGVDAEWTVTFDRDADFVLASSGRPPDHSAIMPARLLAGFAELFDAGFAHSFEVRDAAGKAIGGGFGVAVGGVFVLEGGFEVNAGAARFGLSHLARRLGEWSFSLVECAPGAAWLNAGGFEPVPREEFLSLVGRHASEKKYGRWRDEEDDIAPQETPRSRLAA